MSKRGVTYVRPQEPKFLTKLKAEAGYKEKDSIETKRQALPDITDDDLQDREDELPTVVVLSPGDLTAEQVKEIQKASKCDDDKPVDSNQRILFSKSSIGQKRKSNDSSKKSKRPRGCSNTKLLSFNADGEDDDS